MPLEQPSEEDRQSVLAEVERLRREYLDVKGEFLRILADDKLPARMKALIKAAKVRKVALGRYIDAAAKSARED